ncbi:MAG TPA: GNAT family N-acetyltransferase [Armatimonadota bacterium]|jgi:predicted N-acetyltransferase YhbS
MKTEIRGCRPEELPAVIEGIDQEFITSKHRVLSLAQRFPGTLCRENTPRILVAISEAAICGALSIKPFEWAAPERNWHGAMIGMVWVDAQYRGTGIGGRLLSSATHFLYDSGVDFGVLWTGTPGFYERAGWRLNDSGLFGVAANHAGCTSGADVSCQPLVSVDVAWLENLRSRYLPKRVVRNAADYRTVPIPATRVLCFSAMNPDGSGGYALVGEEDGVGYLYEMVAPPALWDRIWGAVGERFARVYVNGQVDDPFSEWLAERDFVVWEPQHKTMWLSVNGSIGESDFDAWHIPYFDWI